MSGYVASARIVRSTPRLAHGASSGSRHESEPDAITPVSTQLVETIGGEPVPSATSEESRLAAIRERWSQLTFYLFDANAWRS